MAADKLPSFSRPKSSQQLNLQQSKKYEDGFTQGAVVLNEESEENLLIVHNKEHLQYEDEPESLKPTVTQSNEGRQREAYERQRKQN